MKIKSDIAVFIGRFQVPELHPGQLEILEDLLETYKKVVVAIGVSPTMGTKSDPMDYMTREAMIKDFNKDIIVLPVFDNQSDKTWSQELDKILKKTFPIGDIMLFGGRDSFKPFYSGIFPVTEVETKHPHLGTKIREEIGKEILPTIDFRVGQIYSTQNQRPRVFPTVDIALIKVPTENNDLDKVKILLGRKHGCISWRLPGGFVDTTDESYMAAAKRELFEETGIMGNIYKYVGSVLVDDWRYKEDKIMTTLFQTDFVFGHPKASDDLEEVRWFSVDSLEQADITPEHKVLLEMLPCVQEALKEGKKKGY